MLAKTTQLLLVLLLNSVSSVGWVAEQQPANRALELIKKNTTAAVERQQKINQLDDETRALYAEYHATRMQIESLTIYNRQLKQLISNQRASIQNYKETIAQAKEIRPNILPLAERMVDALEQRIIADLPFLPEERHNRIKHLRALLVSTDISPSEKLARVFEAYQIELDYGHTLEAYQGVLDGERVVDFLRIGRNILVYRTLGGESFGIWDNPSRSWLRLHADYHHSVQQGFRIARRTAPPSLLLMPIRVTEGIDHSK